jgi:PAS domain S-box-containing protein
MAVMNQNNHDAAAWLLAVVESSDDAIISKNLQGIISSWNAGAQRLFGYKAEEAIGQSITIIVPSELQEEERQILSRLRDGERIDHFETIRRHKNGSRVHVSLTISPVWDSKGHIVGTSKIARDITERKIDEAIRKDGEIAARLLRARDQERRRLARELHDGVGQLLVALGMDIAEISRERTRLSLPMALKVEESAKLIDQAVAEIRTVSYLLHPPMLEEAGLQPVLKDYIDGFAERSKIRVALELSSGWERLSEDHELCLFRIAQECLTNVHRHSGSSTALVRLSRMPSKAVLEVIDHGTGLEPEILAKLRSGSTSGVGIRGMQERVRQAGGTLTIHSNGSGTSIRAVLPLAQEAPSARSTGSPQSERDQKDDLRSHTPESGVNDSLKTRRPSRSRANPFRSSRLPRCT